MVGSLGVDAERVGRRVEEALERRALGPDVLVEQPRVVAQERVGRLRDEVVELLRVDGRCSVDVCELGRHLLEPEALAER